MKEITFQANIIGCSTQDFFQIACKDSKVIKQFHIEANKDDTVTATEWEQQARVVTFTLAMAIPSSLKRFVGAEPIRIKEKQSYSWDGETLKIVSVPIVQISIAKSLSTQAELVISNTSNGCQIDVAVQVSTSVPWPMTGTVEALMADEAKATVGKYVDYITKYVEDVLNNRLLQPQQEAMQPMEVSAAAADMEEQLDHPLAVVPSVKPAAGAVVSVAAAAGPSAPATPSAAAIWADARGTVARSQPSRSAAADSDVFYDASEGSSAVLEAMLQELKQAQAARQEANRLLLSIKKSLEKLESTVTKEVAFQEGVRYGRGLGTSSLLVSMAAAAAAASAATAYILVRQSSK